MTVFSDRIDLSSPFADERHKFGSISMKEAATGYCKDASVSSNARYGYAARFTKGAYWDDDLVSVGCTDLECVVESCKAFDDQSSSYSYSYSYS